MSMQRSSLFAAISRYEDRELDEQETIDFFQGLIDTGLAWELQGSYGRMAQALIDSGECHWPESIVTQTRLFGALLPYIGKE